MPSDLRKTALASDPLVRAIAPKYLRTEPVLVSARIWWSFRVQPMLNSK
jgi:hypothetical protein